MGAVEANYFSVLARRKAVLSAFLDQVTKVVALTDNRLDQDFVTIVGTGVGPFNGFAYVSKISAVSESEIPWFENGISNQRFRPEHVE